MAKKNLIFIAVISFGIVLTGNIFGQSTKKVKTNRTTNRTSGNLKPRVKNINDQTPADWNERQSQNTERSSVKTAVKAKTGNALDAGFTLSDDFINEAKRKRQTNGRTDQRRTTRTRNLQPEYGGLDPTDERPEFNPAANRKKNTTAQSNLLPYMEQSNIIKKAKVTSSRNSQNPTGRTKSRKKYANQEVSYRRKPVKKRK